MNWSIGSMLFALIAVIVIWLPATLVARFGHFKLSDIRNLSAEHDMIKILVPCLTLVIAIFAYGSSDATAEKQEAAAIKRNAIAKEQNRIAQKQNALTKDSLAMQTQMAEFRGELRFKATYNDEWTLKLQKLDGEPFSLSKVSLTPSFQRSPDVGPEVGQPVQFDPLADYVDSGRSIIIKDAHKRACQNELSKACPRTLEKIFFEFDFGERRHRVVAYRKSD